MREKKSETMTSALTLQLRSFTFEQLETMDARAYEYAPRPWYRCVTNHAHAQGTHSSSDTYLCKRARELCAARTRARHTRIVEVTPLTFHPAKFPSVTTPPCASWKRMQNDSNRRRAQAQERSRVNGVEKPGAHYTAAVIYRQARY